MPKAQVDRKLGFFTFLSNTVTLVSHIEEASFDNLASIVSNRTPQHWLRARNEICNKCPTKTIIPKDLYSFHSRIKNQYKARLTENKNPLRAL